MQPYKDISQKLDFHKLARNNLVDFSASDISKILGISNPSRYAYYNQVKSGVKPPVSTFTQMLFDRGNRMEQTIKDFIRKNPEVIDGCELRETGIWISMVGDHLLGASPDGELIVEEDGTKINLEIKASVPACEEAVMEPFIKATDMPQVLAQMYCTGLDRTLYMRHNGKNKLGVWAVNYDPKVWEFIAVRCRLFFDFMAEGKVPPQRMPSGEKELVMRTLEEFVADNATHIRNYTLEDSFYVSSD
jgi:hypothetical protein